MRTVRAKRTSSSAGASRTVVLAGPQHPQPNLGEIVGELGIRGPVAVVAAGWQERETDAGVIPEIDLPMVHLGLHSRAEEIFSSDPGLGQPYKARQTRLRLMQDFYRVRLDHAGEAARAISLRHVAADLLAEERTASIAHIRDLDKQHLERCRAVHDQFDTEYPLAERKSVASHRKELAALIAPTDAILIAGGHVGVLLNRLRLFDLISLAGNRPIIAWSAGAMTLCELVVLFHDDPPNGVGRAEILDLGLGLVPKTIALPDPKHRLRLDDPDRVGMFARRFAPFTCATLGHGASITARDGRIVQSNAAQKLAGNGTTERVGP